MAIFGRQSDYDTSQDNLVRVHVSELGKKLEEHFRTEGAEEPASPHRPRVFPRYSTITVTSASDACAPRATIFCTIAFQSVGFIRWLVTTSTG